MRIQDIIEQMPAEVAGKTALVLAGGGTFVQIATQFGSILLIVLNVTLAIGGLWLLRLKFKEQRAVTASRRARERDGGGGT